MKKNNSRGLVAGWRQLLLALALAGLSAGVTPAMAATVVKDKSIKAPTTAKKAGESAGPRKASTKRKATASKKRSSRPKSRVSRKSVTRRSVRRVVAIAPAAPSMGQLMGLQDTHDDLRLKSSVAMVVDQKTHEVLYSKNSHAVLPIASITKLMTALVVLDAHQPMDEMLDIGSEDVDTEKNSHSRLSVGTQLSRSDLLLLALMSSENRAASALGRHYPGGQRAFIAAMNRKAQELGMRDSRFVCATGLSSGNVSSAADLVRLVNAAYREPLIRYYSTQPEHTVVAGRRTMHFVSSNRLVRYSGEDWEIGLQKTGYISEAGRCLVMQTRVGDRPVVMVFLDSDGKLTRFADAQRVRSWLESQPRQQVASPGPGASQPLPPPPPASTM